LTRGRGTYILPHHQPALQSGADWAARQMRAAFAFPRAPEFCGEKSSQPGELGHVDSSSPLAIFLALLIVLAESPRVLQVLRGAVGFQPVSQGNSSLTSEPRGSGSARHWLFSARSTVTTAVGRGMRMALPQQDPLPSPSFGAVLVRISLTRGGVNYIVTDHKRALQTGVAWHRGNACGLRLPSGPRVPRRKRTPTGEIAPCRLVVAPCHLFSHS
jgi:hypothetical protein